MQDAVSVRPDGSSALNLAAYVTLAAVTFGVWQDAARWPPVGPVDARLAVVGLIGLFLAAFVSCTRDGEHPGWRRILAIGVMIVSALALLLLGTSGTSAILLIILAAVLTSALPPRTAWAVLAAVNVVFLAILLLRWRFESPLVAFLVYGGFQAFAGLASGAVARAEAIAGELRQVNAGLLATRSLLAESARDGERLRMSRELHDVAGHKLTALKLNLEVLARDLAGSPRRELEVSRQLAAELLDDVRSVVSQLRRDDGLDLGEALERLAEPFPRPRVHLEVDPLARAADAGQAEALVRAAQEGLTNAARHARAGNVWLSLGARDGALELVIEDDGSFGGSHAPGHGLTGMRERLESVGGTLETGRGARGGFRLAARVPRGRAA